MNWSPLCANALASQKSQELRRFYGRAISSGSAENMGFWFSILQMLSDIFLRDPQRRYLVPTGSLWLSRAGSRKGQFFQFNPDKVNQTGLDQSLFWILLISLMWECACRISKYDRWWEGCLPEPSSCLGGRERCTVHPEPWRWRNGSHTADVRNCQNVVDIRWYK
jgi:hypothetical protein